MERRDGEVGLGLWRHRAWVAEDAHHLQERQAVPEAGLQGTDMKGRNREVQGRPKQCHRLVSETGAGLQCSSCPNVGPRDSFLSGALGARQTLCHFSVPYGLVRGGYPLPSAE